MVLRINVLFMLFYTARPVTLTTRGAALAALATLDDGSTGCDHAVIRELETSF
jgi:hypothetical protein